MISTFEPSVEPISCDAALPDGLTGALLAFEGIQDAAVILHGPTGCRGHHRSLSERAFPRDMHPERMYFAERFYFGQPRIPTTCLDGDDFIFGTAEKLKQAMDVVSGRRPGLLAVVNSPGAALIGEDLNRIAAEDRPLPASSLERRMLACLERSRSNGLAIVFLAALLLVPATGIPADANAAAGLDAGGEQQVATERESSFPHRTQIRHARGFTLEYCDSCKRLEVLTPWRNAQETFAYILVPRGSKPPADVPRGAMVVEVPVKRMVLSSTVCVALLPLLHVEETLVGFSGLQLVNTPQIVELIRKGNVEEVSGGGDGMARQLNLERLYVLRPDLIVVNGTGIPEFDTHPKLMEAGFKTAVYSNYMESTPLGRAEWIKFLAAFFNKEADADRVFDDIVERYNTLLEQTRGVGRRPTVFHGITYQSTWYTPGGDSYFARFIKDAGGDYVWADDRTTGSMPVAMEALLERARDADVWLEPGLCSSLQEVAASDDRVTLFRAFRTGQVYNNNARTGPGGGNDFWEGGIARPDLVLADLISIFHPELIPGHQRIWYQQLPNREEGAP